ncbi:MAG: YihY/virulence factor BrkB family protein [Actinomycetota bacterium]|nr:YihY/virulence factor BrkB family protein [Actinomycetota bacterium]
MTVIDRAKDGVARARRRWPLLDHLVRTVEHYTSSGGAAQAGNITYFGFLAFFPILAIGFAVVGWVSVVYPDAETAMGTALSDALPGIFGDEDGEISSADFQGAAAAAGLIGAVGLLYAGLNWLSALREGVQRVFDVGPGEAPSFVGGKLRDLLTMGTLGLVLVLSVSVTGAATGAGDWLLEQVRLDGVPGTGLLLDVLGLLLGVLASTMLFLAIFRLLAAPEDIPPRALLHGALFSALGFEILKRLSLLVIGSVSSSPAAAVFGTALVLVVWINYFARVTLLGASWAETSPITVEARMPARKAAALDEAETIAQIEWGPDEDGEEAPREPALVALVRAGVAFAAITVLLRRLSVPHDD